MPHPRREEQPEDILRGIADLRQAVLEMLSVFPLSICGRFAPRSRANNLQQRDDSLCCEDRECARAMQKINSARSKQCWVVACRISLFPCHITYRTFFGVLGSTGRTTKQVAVHSLLPSCFTSLTRPIFQQIAGSFLQAAETQGILAVLQPFLGPMILIFSVSTAS